MDADERRFKGAACGHALFFAFYLRHLLNP